VHTFYCILYQFRISALFYNYYGYVTTWCTMDYTSVTSIMHCRNVVTLLFQTSSSVSIAAKRIVVEMMMMFMFNMSEYELQLSSWWCWRRVLLIIDLQCNFFYISHDKYADDIKIWELSTATQRGMYMTVRLSYGIIDLRCLWNRSKHTDL